MLFRSGISRKYVIEEIAPALGIKVIEKNIEAYDVYTADEAFLTGTPFCMLPVTSLNGVAIGSGKVGPLFAKLLAQWSSNVGIDIQNQIKSWASEDLSNGPTPYQFRSK